MSQDLKFAEKINMRNGAKRKLTRSLIYDLLRSRGFWREAEGQKRPIPSGERLIRLIQFEWKEAKSASHH